MLLQSSYRLTAIRQDTAEHCCTLHEVSPLHCSVGKGRLHVVAYRAAVMRQSLEALFWKETKVPQLLAGYSFAAACV